MAVQSVQMDGTFEAWQPWMKRGGKSTYASYIVQAEGDLWQAKQTMLDDFMWLDNLPTQIVLDHIRLVHAGYDPRMPLDMQGRERTSGFENSGSSTKALSTRPEPSSLATPRPPSWAAQVKLPETVLPDGRPAWIGVDVGAYNHVSPGLVAMDVSTFRVVKQPTLRCDRWFERINTRKTRRKTPFGKERRTCRRPKSPQFPWVKALAARARQHGGPPCGPNERWRRSVWFPLSTTTTDDWWLQDFQTG